MNTSNNNTSLDRAKTMLPEYKPGWYLISKSDAEVWKRKKKDALYLHTVWPVKLLKSVKVQQSINKPTHPVERLEITHVAASRNFLSCGVLTIIYVHNTIEMESWQSEYNFF